MSSFKREGIFTAFHFLLILSIKSFILCNSEVILPVSYFSCKQNINNITKYYITKKTFMEHQLLKIDLFLKIFMVVNIADIFTCSDSQWRIYL